MPATEVFAPAKINLTLHVTGQRADGYHLLDSLVMFADVGDRVTVRAARETSLTVTGPMAAGVPTDARNLCWRAAQFFGETISITLEKHLPAAAGIGGGSSDAAAVLRAMQVHFDRPAPLNPISLGADIPVCQIAHAARMEGIGNQITPLTMAPIRAILVNPGVSVATPAVFAALENKKNPPMTPWPAGGASDAVLTWLGTQRNDLEAPAITAQPVIMDVLNALARLNGVRLTRMSGSGATCFALFDGDADQTSAARSLQKAHPNWWIRACRLS